MTDYIISLIIFASIQVATPGPANVIIMANAMRFGVHPIMPFVAGVILGKQFIVWPIGFGLMLVLEKIPLLYMILQGMMLLYMTYLAWKIANLRIHHTEAKNTRPPNFWAGLLVHPVNPKAWAMIITIFTYFLPKENMGFQNTAIVALCLFFIQIVFQPLWAVFGTYIRQVLMGKRIEKYIMKMMAATILIVLLWGLFDGTNSFIG